MERSGAPRGLIRRGARSARVAFAIAASACIAPLPTSHVECRTREECPAGQVCFDNACRTVCNVTRDCNGELVCEGGVCVEPAESSCLRAGASCDVNAICQPTTGPYQCVCDTGYTGDGTRCDDIDECADGLDNCHADAVCDNTDGAFTCTCRPGFDGDGIACTDVDECASGLDDCDANATCANTIGDFECTCNVSYEGDGVTCTALPATWAKRAGDAADDWGRSVATDSSSNAYATGSFQTSATFGANVLAGSGEDDGYIVSFAPDGTPRWSKRWGGSYSDSGYAIAVDSSDRVFVAGMFTDTADLGGGALPAPGNRDAMLAHFTAGGVHQWSHGHGGWANDAATAVAAANGRVCMAGHFFEEAVFGGPTLTAVGDNDIFVACYASSTGAHIWSVGAGSAGDDRVLAMAVDAAGNVFVTGIQRGGIDFGAGALPYGGAEDAFLVSFDDTGGHRWSRSIGDADADHGTGVAVDDTGNVYLAVRFWGTTNLGDGTLTSRGYDDIAIGSYLVSNGSHRWTRHFGSIWYDEPTAIGVDGDELFFTGGFQSSIDFGGGALTSAGAYDVYIAVLDTLGGYRDSVRFGGTDHDNGFAVARSPAGAYLVTGPYYGASDYGTGPLSSAGGRDAFVFQYDP